MEDFEQNKVHLLKILLNNLIFFWFSKFLELFFAPENTPSKLKNSNISKREIFFLVWFIGNKIQNYVSMNWVKIFCSSIDRLVMGE